MKKISFVLMLLLDVILLQAQSITGTLSQLSNQNIRLEAFNGFKTYQVTSTSTDAQGNFILKYSKNDYGLGYLISSENKPFFVILSGEEIEIRGETLSLTETIKTIKETENLAFARYASEHPRREQALEISGENIYL